MNHPSPPIQTRPAGLFEATIQKLFTRSATVLDIADIGPSFRIITLGGDALRGAGWTPGDKIQLQLGGWVQRTYTPLDWDAVIGRTRILVFLHADGPGTQWARSVRKGDDCIVFGPRKSIQLAPQKSAVIVFGDETSLGLAAAFAAHGTAPEVHLLLEVSDVAAAMPVIAHLQLDGTHVRARRADDAHFTGLEAALTALLMVDAGAEIVLTGRAGAIQHMTRFLRQTEVGTGRRQSKAYWAAGKKGLD